MAPLPCTCKKKLKNCDGNCDFGGGQVKPWIIPNRTPVKNKTKISFEYSADPYRNKNQWCPEPKKGNNYGQELE